jgi:hypothetical protein
MSRHCVDRQVSRRSTAFHIPAHSQASKQHRTSPRVQTTHKTQLYIHRRFSNLKSAWTTGSLGCTRLCGSKPQVWTQICPVTRSDIWCMHPVKRSTSSKPSLQASFPQSAHDLSPISQTRQLTIP